MLKNLFDLGDDHKRVITILFNYLFGSIGKYEYRKQLGDKHKAKLVWSIAESSGYVLRNCKLYAYAHATNSRMGLPTSPGRFQIEQADAAFLRSLDLSHIPTSYKAYSLFDFDQLEGSIMTSQELKVYIGKFISKKLIFLTRSYGVSREEIHSGMLMAGLFALRKKYPCYETTLHATNIIKTSIQNYGQGLIEFYTRDKRNALIKEGNGLFSAVHVQYDALNDVSVQPEHSDDLRVIRRSLISLLPKLKPKAQEFVQAAVGVYDEGFSVYIGQDNRDAVEAWDYDQRYLPSLCSYLKVSKEQAHQLMAQLKGQL
jgi:hypothetical protein